jgi:hypothetical protein
MPGDVQPARIPRAGRTRARWRARHDHAEEVIVMISTDASAGGGAGNSAARWWQAAMTVPGSTCSGGWLIANPADFEPA